MNRMKTKTRNRWILFAAVLAAAGAIWLPARVQAQGAEDDPFYKGLRQRGLQSLMRAYLEEKGVSGAEAESHVTKADQAALEVEKAAAAKSVEERDACFERARALYEEAIAETQKALAQVPAAQWKARADARLQILQWRAELAKMIFQNWLKSDLDVLEVTDRRGGNRQEAARLLKVAEEQFHAVFRGGTEWLSEIDRDADPAKYRNAYSRRVENLRREAEYHTAWVMYYLAWVRPKDYQPAEGETSRDGLLKGAITTFEGYLSLPDKVAAKWYAYLVIGLAQRALGKYEDALTSLAYADNAAAPEELKIRVAFERALTRVRQGEYKKAREAIETAREFFGTQKVDQNLYGLAMPLVEAETYILEAQAKPNAALKQKGLDILAEMNSRPAPWPAIVSFVMPGLVGTPDDVEQMDPFPLWILATDTYEKARQQEDTKQLEYAMRLYKIYAEKVGPQDENYAAALYSQAACLLQLGRKEDAAEAFKTVAESAPNYRYAPDAAKYYVGVRGQVYEVAKTDENRDAYEKALAWFVSKWLRADPDQQYFYALILYRGAKYEEAADQFTKVAQDSEYYPDARYWVALARLEDFRENVLPAGQRNQIFSRARVVAQELTDFANYARQVQGLPDTKRQELQNWAQAAFLNAAAIYMYPEVGLYTDGLQLLEQMEKAFPKLDKEMEGRLLKYKIEAYRRLGELDKAKKVLDTFLAQADPAEVGSVLPPLLQAYIEDVQRLIKTGNKETARTKVKDAEELGDRLREWFKTAGVENPEAQAENIQYDLAELYLAVGDFDVAKKIYEEIGGPKPEEAAPIKVDCVYGLARCHEALAEGAPDAAQGRQYFERSLELWRALLDIESQGQKSDAKRIWNYRYHVFYCRYRLGERDEVRKALEAQEILSRPDPLGGADAELQQKFRQLRTWVTGAAPPK